MNRKKITKTALTGLVAVTMVPALAMPLVANAEEDTAPVVDETTTAVTENEETSTPVNEEGTPTPAEGEEVTSPEEGATTPTEGEEVTPPEEETPEVPEGEATATLKVYATISGEVYENGVPVMGALFPWNEEFTATGKVGEKHIFEVTLTPLEGYVIVEGNPTFTVEVEYGKTEEYKSGVVCIKSEYADDYLHYHGITTNQPSDESGNQESGTVDEVQDNETQNGEAQNVSAKEEPKQESKGVHTGIATPLAGIFGTMSTALAGMIALLRRKQK